MLWIMNGTIMFIVIIMLVKFYLSIFNIIFECSKMWLRSLHTESVFFFFFRIRHPFLSKCLLRMQKRRKSNLIQKKFMTDESFVGSVNMTDTTWGHIYFLTCENFGREYQTQCARTYTHTDACVFFFFSIQFWPCATYSPESMVNTS